MISGDRIVVVVLRVVWGWLGSWVGARRCATPRVLVEADMVVFGPVWVFEATDGSS